MTSLIVDCNNLCYSAMFTIKNLSYDEKRTEIIFSFLNQIFRLAKVFETNKFIFCWDSRKSYRKQIYPPYKKKRQDNLTLEELEDRKVAFKQFSELRQKVIPELGFKNNFIVTGYEADDLIAYTSVLCDESMIISTDKDLFQLLTDNCRMYNGKTKKILTRKNFTKEYGIEPKQWAEVKAMAGCGTDEVEGIKGIGEGRAIKYLLDILPDGVYKNSIGSKEGKEIIERNRILVTLPLSFSPALSVELNYDKVFSLNSFINVFNEYDFQTFLRKDSLNRLKKSFDLV